MRGKSTDNPGAELALIPSYRTLPIFHEFSAAGATFSSRDFLNLSNLPPSADAASGTGVGVGGKGGERLLASDDFLSKIELGN